MGFHASAFVPVLLYFDVCDPCIKKGKEYSGFHFPLHSYRKPYRAAGMAVHEVRNTGTAFENNKKRYTCAYLHLAPQVGLEPTTLRLTAACSTS